MENNWNSIDQFLEETLLKPDPVLEQALEAAEAAGLPAIQVTALQGSFLHILAKAIGARLMLEIGTLGGYSSIWLARALPADGRLVTLEANPKHADVAEANFAAARLAERIELRRGKALDTLPTLMEEYAGQFDLIFIDADKANLAAYFEWARKLARPGGLILTDNVVRRGAILEAGAADENAQGARRFLAALGASQDVRASALQTVGSKGHDGFAIAVVEAKN